MKMEPFRLGAVYLGMGYTPPRWTRLAYWNLWPALRLLLVMAAVGVWAHRSLGLHSPSPHMWGEISGGPTILLVVCAVLSLPLARLYLVLLCFPLYVAVILNALFYDGPRLMMRQLIGPRPPCLEASLALASELGLFMSLVNSIASVLQTYCHF